VVQPEYWKFEPGGGPLRLNQAAELADAGDLARIALTPSRRATDGRDRSNRW
jgi:hypothetical protein